MARLNISLPDDLYEAAQKWRGKKNLSRICARALREELEAVESERNPGGLFSIFKRSSVLEKALARQFGLAAAAVVETPDHPGEIRDVLGERAANYLDRWLCDDALLGVAGGRQTWAVVRSLSPRSIRLTITALGFKQNDPEVLHVHANTLTSFLWLLYSPGAKARLVAAIPDGTLWFGDLPVRSRPSYFVLASCAPLQAESAFAALLGERLTENLRARRVSGDFAYVFFGPDGAPLGERSVIPTRSAVADHSLLSAGILASLSRRPDARVIAVAGGEDKLPILRHTLAHQLCNVLITDRCTAEALVH
jgi:DNA-binding transcriptional regulator LsrR (DeoR family)